MLEVGLVAAAFTVADTGLVDAPDVGAAAGDQVDDQARHAVGLVGRGLHARAAEPRHHQHGRSTRNATRAADDGAHPHAAVQLDLAQRHIDPGMGFHGSRSTLRIRLARQGRGSGVQQHSRHQHWPNATVAQRPELRDARLN